ncbi:M20/M25/M40 family metallo-hydrolase [Microbacterium sp. Marseille-Q6965]|uniref:M20/M25/M40 family metallo-hydrolase n=1 Tax=Microbacterium sp. Marseille-Q6965 TaxID=2965072 RepID=UPI0021B7B584|nr:M20/M25/M40 family metallo-hydrolase [Microbacterium sp. Marseille-Q6965]
MSGSASSASYRWAGASSQDPLVLMAHVDVVPADQGDGWSAPPFDGRIAEGFVWGRGALDDKGPLLVILEAVEELLRQGFSPARDVYLSFGGDEEVFGRAAAAIAETLAARGVSPWLVLDEGGAVVDAPLPFVPGRAAMIGLGEKGIVTLRLRARGDGGHASAPRGHTAISRLARAIERLNPATFPPRAPQTIARMLAVLGARAGGVPGVVLRVLASVPRLAGPVLARMGSEPAALVRTTLAATRLSGGSADNVLPSHATATLNLRLIPGDTVGTVVARVRRRVRDPKVSVELVDGSDPSPESPADSAAFAALRAAVGAAFPDALVVPYLMMQASDARHFHRRWPSVYRFAPLEMSAAQRASIHGSDERVEIASLERGRDFHMELIRGLS